MPGPLRGAGGSAPPKGRRPKCGAGGGLLCPPGASAPYGGPEASAPPSRRGGPGGRRVDGTRRVPSLKVFFSFGRNNRVCEGLCERKRVIMARDGKEGGEPSAGLFGDFVDAGSSRSGVPGWLSQGAVSPADVKAPDAFTVPVHSRAEAA